MSIDECKKEITNTLMDIEDIDICSSILVLNNVANTLNSEEVFESLATICKTLREK